MLFITNTFQNQTLPITHFSFLILSKIKLLPITHLSLLILFKIKSLPITQNFIDWISTQQKFIHVFLAWERFVQWINIFPQFRIWLYESFPASKNMYKSVYKTWFEVNEAWDVLKWRKYWAPGFFTPLTKLSHQLPAWWSLIV